MSRTFNGQLSILPIQKAHQFEQICQYYYPCEESHLNPPHHGKALHDGIAKPIEFLNPCQAHVIMTDPALYAISQKLQWNFTNQCRQESFVVMLRPLHMEIAQQGTWQKEVDEIQVVVQNAGTLRPRVVQTLRTGHDIVRNIHQVTACCLDILMYGLLQRRNIKDT